jgi:hypothetical protein
MLRAETTISIAGNPQGDPTYPGEEISFTETIAIPLSFFLSPFIAFCTNLLVEFQFDEFLN